MPKDPGPCPPQVEPTRLGVVVAFLILAPMAFWIGFMVVSEFIA